MFSEASVILSMGGKGLSSGQTAPPPPHGQRSPWIETPRIETSPTGQRPAPWTQTSLLDTDPPPPDRDPKQRPPTGVTSSGGNRGGRYVSYWNAYLLPSAKKLRRLCFYTCLSFCSQGGGLPQYMLGYHPPPREAHLPREAHPPPGSTHTIHCQCVRESQG